MKVEDVKRKSDVQEARRRARILERYNDIDRPTADDDAAAAADLGLSVDRMIRLAAVWKRYRNEAMLVGRTAALERVGEAAPNEVMAQRIDLDLVHAERRIEILRRIRIIQRYIAASERGSGDIKSAAEELGVSVERFRVLVQTWRLQARAEALPGATRRSNLWRRQPKHARRQELLKSALDNADPKDNLRTVYDAFVAACLAEDMKPLGIKRFYGIVHDLRAGKIPEQKTK